MAKTLPSNFQVITPKIPLLSKQAVISKGIPVPYINLQLNPYPNTQLDLFCSDNFPFDARLPSTWLTNTRILVCNFNHQLEKIVDRKVLQFILTMKIKKMLGHKTLWCTYITTSSQEWWTRAKLCLWLQIAWTNFAQLLCNLCTLWRPLK